MTLIFGWMSDHPKINVMISRARRMNLVYMMGSEEHRDFYWIKQISDLFDDKKSAVSMRQLIEVQNHLRKKLNDDESLFPPSFF